MVPSASLESGLRKRGLFLTLVQGVKQTPLRMIGWGGPIPVSSNEDLCLHGEQMLRMAKVLDIDVDTSDNRPKDKILNCLYTDCPGIMAFSG